jgi:hypothetical protein
MGAPRTDINWAEIKAVWSTDQLSTREIGRQFAVSSQAITKRAVKEGWSKGLSFRVAAGVRDAVVTGQLPKAPKTAREVTAAETATKVAVTNAIEQGKQAVLRHISLGKLLTHNSHEFAEAIGTQLAEVKALLDAGPGPELGPKEAATVTAALTRRLADLARAHDSLARASVNAMQIERKSRGLDDMPPDPDAPSAISITYYRQDVVNLPPTQQPAIDIGSGKKG